MWESTSESWPSYLGIVGVFVSVATNYHTLSGLKQQKVILSGKEAGSLKSRCLWGWFLLMGLRARVVVAVAILALPLTSLMVSIFTQPSPSVSLCPHFPCLEDTS